MYNSVQTSKSDIEASNRIFPANHHNASPFHLIQTTHIIKKKMGKRKRFFTQRMYERQTHRKTPMRVSLNRTTSDPNSLL